MSEPFKDAEYERQQRLRILFKELEHYYRELEKNALERYQLEQKAVEIKAKIIEGRP